MVAVTRVRTLIGLYWFVFCHCVTHVMNWQPVQCQLGKASKDKLVVADGWTSFLMRLIFFLLSSESIKGLVHQEIRIQS